MIASMALKLAMSEKDPTDLPPIYIREWIDHLELDQKDLAEPMGTSDSQISRLLTGKRKLSLEWMASFARALNVQVSDLFKPPVTADGRTQNDDEIRTLLKAIKGLEDKDITMLLSIIKNAIQANSIERERTQLRDQSEPTTLRHAEKPSRQR